MARRRSRDESVLDQLFEIAALLPWQVGVSLALVAFLGFHWYAGTEPPVFDVKLRTQQTLYLSFSETSLVSSRRSCST